jgi:hypothetical protein
VLTIGIRNVATESDTSVCDGCSSQGEGHRRSENVSHIEGRNQREQGDEGMFESGERCKLETATTNALRTDSPPIYYVFPNQSVGRQLGAL